MTTPQVTFGMIVLNGEPYTRYNLHALYPFAHQIIIVEGACPSAKNVATPDGHSRDGTLAVLRQFKQEEDPENKVCIITAEDEGYPTGFWPEKDEMSQAYALRATGNYLWQIDVDEFYREQDMQTILDILGEDPTIKAATFQVLTFWGGLKYRTDSDYLQGGAHYFHRLFAWGPGYKYLTHRPPTVIDEQGRDLRQIRELTGKQLAHCGIYMYHYELLLPKQVLEKCEYYTGAGWTDALRNANTWSEECYFQLNQPFRVHMVYQYISWLERYYGEHPQQINKMVDAIKMGQHPGVQLRQTGDIEELLSNPMYISQRAWLKVRLPLTRFVIINKRRLLIHLRETPLGPLLKKFRNRLRKSGKSSVSSGYRSIKKEQVTTELAEAWQSDSIVVAQRKLVDQELRNMYRGNVAVPYQVLANAIKVTGSETGEIIEIGCSSGYYYEVLSHLLGHEVQYKGIDYSKAMIDCAKQHYPKHTFEVGDACALSLNNNSCDVLISGCCLLHIPDYEVAIAESVRVSREWVIFHRTPVVSGATQYYTKEAYGVPCVEIHFGQQELFQLFHKHGLRVITQVQISEEQKTYVCQKVVDKKAHLENHDVT